MAMSAGQSVPKITRSMPAVSITMRKGGFTVGQAIVVEFIEICAGGTLDIHTGLRAYLPAPVHTANAKSRYNHPRGPGRC